MKEKLRKMIRYANIAKMKLIRRVSKKRREARGASQEEKWNALDDARRRGNIGVFVETGTYKGDTVERFKNDFEKIYSIEVGAELAAAAKKRFAGDRRVEIVVGDSADALPPILAKLHGPALFWLDAHCSEGDTARGADYSPIISELRAILSSPPEHTIFIDDARLFDGVNYPTLQKIRRLAKKLRPEFSYRVLNDIIRINPYDKN